MRQVADFDAVSGLEASYTDLCCIDAMGYLGSFGASRLLSLARLPQSPFGTLVASTCRWAQFSELRWEVRQSQTT